VYHLRRHRRIASAISALLLTAVSGGQAAPELSANLGIGVGYDSNVSVEEIERPSGEGDQLRSADAQVDITDTLFGVTGTLTYAYSSTDFQEFDNVSRQTQTWGASLETEVGKTRIGASYFAADADLADDPFLTYERFSPYVSGFVSRRWFVRGAWVSSEKTIVNRPGRDSESQAVEIDGYYFWRGLRRYLNVGYSYEDDDSRANRYDYGAHLVKLRMIQRFNFMDRLGSAEFGVWYESRDYTDITPQIGVEREDKRTRVRGEVSLPLSSKLFWRVYARYGNYESNLDSVDYEEAVIGTQLELQF
jgi:hypothetical protein